MVTVLDTGLLKSFDVVFVVLLIWTMVFALLQKTKAIGDFIGINATIAAAIAFLSLISDTLVKLISFMITWFALVIIFLVLLLLLFQIFGVSDFSKAVADPSVRWTIIGIGIVIVFASFANVFGQQLTEASFNSGQSPAEVSANGVGTQNFQQNIYATLFHPKVLGMIILFTIAIFAVVLLSGNP